MFERKVLFKAKNKDKKWIFGIPYIEEDSTYLITIIPDSNCRSYSTKVDPDTLCEYTNKDTLDNEQIFENDLFLDEGKYWKIVYSKELCGFQGQFIDKKTGFEFLLPIFHFLDEKKVGNAIDNPELVFREQKE